MIIRANYRHEGCQIRLPDGKNPLQNYKITQKWGIFTGYRYFDYPNAPKNLGVFFRQNKISS